MPVVLLAALLAGCSNAESGADPGADPDATGSGPGTGAASYGSAPTTPTDDPLGDLARLAEGAAGDVPTGGPSRDPAVPVLGGDVSWPQCPRGMGLPEKRTLGMPMPLDAAEYVVVGLTNGPGFHVNPCLADQVAWVAERHLLGAAYAVASFPDPATLATHGTTGPYDGGSPADALRNTGYAQGRFNVASMQDAGLLTPVVWIDVEPVPDFEWSDDPVANAAVVEGLARAYTDAGYAIGVYSTPHLWRQVVGDLALGVPEWRAAGHTSRAEALSRCADDWSIQGGAAVLGQWVEADRDQNVTCPGVAAELDRWFHQY
ncbi:MAG TPA: hypothetical protein VGE77_11210 [Nocardioides sp.]